MEHRIFMRVDLPDWVFGTVDKVRRGQVWGDAWPATYHEIGGRSCHTGSKGCPMAAARTLYEYGRIRGCGVAYRDCDLRDLWVRQKNGTYAMLAIRLLREQPELGKPVLWERIRETVRREFGDEPAVSNQGGPTLAFQLFHLGLVVDEER